MQQGSEGSEGLCALKERLFTGSDLLKPPKYYSIIRLGKKSTFSGMPRLQEVVVTMQGGKRTEVFPIPHGPAHCS